jgi:hypothetical protein
MKRFVILFLVSLASITSTQAWSGIGNPATRIFAQQFMTAEARRENSRIWRLSKKYPAEKSEKPTDVRWNRVSLDSDLRSTTTYEGDVVY